MSRLALTCCLLATPWLVGCPSQGIQAINASPEAAIISHADGDVVIEGDLVSFIGVVSDPDHEAADLIATWSLGEREICPPTAAAGDGTTSCEATIGPDETSLRLAVVDPKGAAGAAVVTLVVTPTEAPTASILEPSTTGIYYSDQLVPFEGVVADAEDSPESLTAWWESSVDGGLEVETDPDSSGSVLGVSHLSEGEHAITLHVRDTTGKTGSDSVIVTVGPPNSPPSCAITAPESGTVGSPGARVTFEAQVADVDVPADWLDVTWSSDKDGVMGTSTPSSAGEVVFAWSDLSVATHTISVTVADELGATCTDFILFTVGSAPEVTLSAPSSGAVFNEGEAITFSAQVSDGEDAAADLDLAWVSDVDGLISSQHADSSGLAQFSRADLTAGPHLVTLTATDSDGLLGTATVDFTINELPTAPTVAISPDPAVTTDDLLASASGSVDPDASGTVTYSYAWYEDGVLASTSGATLPASATTKGRTYRVVVTPNDGIGDGATGEASLIVGNSLPTISSASISPSTGISTGTILTCSASATDPDGDAPVLDYAWTDGSWAPLGVGSTLALSPALVGPGSLVVCSATATDDEGATAVSIDSVMVVNSDPVVDSVAITPSVGVTTSSTLTCAATATDPDGGSPSVSYAWSDGTTALGSGATLTLSPSSSAPGDTITCLATALDSDGGTGTDSASVVVENSDPVVSAVAIAPATGVTTSSTLTCSATAADPDGSALALGYTWSSGGSTVGTGTSLVLTPVLCSPGDEITCTTTATDPDGGVGIAEATVTVENSAPSVASVAISPDPAFAADTLACAWTGYSDPDGDPDASTVAWTVNGSTAGSGATLAGGFAGGDTVTCTVTPFDGMDEGPAVVDSLVISNTPPVLDDVTLGPDPAYEGDTLTCTPGLVADDDGDSVTYAYAWEVEGVDPGVTAATLSSAFFDRDETVTCTVTPNDGTEDGSPVTSNAVTIYNTAPSIASVAVAPVAPTAADTLTCTYSGYADADGDPDASTVAWTVEGVAAGISSTLAGVFGVGDLVVCTVTPHDGSDAGVAMSASVAIENQPPEVLSVVLSPTSVATDDALTAVVSTTDADGDAVTVSYAWYVDSTLLGATGASLDGSTWFDRDQVVYVVATPNDGVEDGLPAASASVTVLDTAPGAPVVSISPEEPLEGEDDLVCLVDTEAADIDGDVISYTFTWTLDGAAWGGSTSTTVRAGDTIAAADTAMDDVWACEVTPSDGDLDGPSASASVVVLHAFVGGDISLSAAGAKLIGEDDFDNAGASVAFAGDVDGDGFDDVIVGARYHYSTSTTCPGSAYLVLGPVYGEVDLGIADAELVGVAHSEEAGGSVASAGDVNGDGYADLLIGAQYRSVGALYTGTAYLVLGPVSGSLSLSLADGTFTGEDTADVAGRVVASAGDVDGDGNDDVIVGAQSADVGGSYSGVAYLLHGPRTGTTSLATADARLIGEDPFDYAGRSVASAGDLDGDGLSDILVGSYGDSTGGEFAGSTYVVDGPVVGDFDLSAADAKYVGEQAYDRAGDVVSSAGDVDGDGYRDILIGASYESSAGEWAGAAYLVLGPHCGIVDLSMCDAKMTGETSRDFAGSSVSSAGDIDADGFDDVLIGAICVSTADYCAGATYLVRGPFSGEFSLSDADARVLGEQYGDTSGMSVAGVGDADADGVPDILIGAPQEDSGGNNAGAAYLVYGADL